MNQTQREGSLVNQTQQEGSLVNQTRLRVTALINGRRTCGIWFTRLEGWGKVWD